MAQSSIQGCLANDSDNPNHLILRLNTWEGRLVQHVSTVKSISLAHLIAYQSGSYLVVELILASKKFLNVVQVVEMYAYVDNKDE